MKPALPEPRDYVQHFSPDQEADLQVHIVDERPKPGLRPLARRARSALRLFLTGRDANDVEAERAWDAMRSTWGDTSPETVQRFLRQKFSTDPLRKFEYAFLAQCLSRLAVPGTTLLDMGGGNSYSTVVPLLLRLPDTQVWSLDPVNRPTVSRYGARYLRGDCMDTRLPEESVDIVTIISTLEHVGLGRWGDPLDVDGDIKAMREARRILRPAGHVVLTIPCGYPTVVYNLHRIYDRGRLGTLLEGFVPVTQEYSLLGSPATREQVEGKKATFHIPGFDDDIPDHLRHPDAQGGALLLLRKS